MGAIAREESRIPLITLCLLLSILKYEIKRLFSLYFVVKLIICRLVKQSFDIRNAYRVFLCEDSDAIVDL